MYLYTKWNRSYYGIVFIINLSRCLRCVDQPPTRSLPPNFSKVTNLTDLWTYVTCHSHPYSWACPRAVHGSSTTTRTTVVWVPFFRRGVRVPRCWPSVEARPTTRLVLWLHQVEARFGLHVFGTKMSVKLDLTSIVSSVPKPPYVCLRWWNPNFGSPEVPSQCFHNPSKLSVGKNDCADRKLILLGLSCLQLGKRCYLMGRESRYTHLVVVWYLSRFATSTTRTPASLAQPKPTGVKLGRPWP